MKRALLILTATALSVATAATNLVSNTATVTNRCAAIVTYTMSNGVARVQDPSGKLIGTAEERALKVAAEGQADIASAAADAAGTAMEEWREFTATTDVKVCYIDAGFTQDLPALAMNLCGWVAGSFYDSENGEDHYYIWFNREMDAPPAMCARIISERGTNWLDGTWKDWAVTNWIEKATCRELVVPRHNANCVLKTGTVITLGGKDGFDADIHKVNVEVGERINYLRFYPGSYFGVSGLNLTAAERNAVSYVAKVRIPEDTTMAYYYYYFDNATRYADGLAMCLAYTRGNTACNFKLNGNSSGTYFNPPIASLSEYAGEWVELESGFETLANGDIHTFYKVNGEIVTEKTSDHPTSTRGWENSFQLGNGNAYGSSGNCEIEWVEIRSEGKIIHRFVPREDLTMVDTVGFATLTRVGSNFEYATATAKATTATISQQLPLFHTVIYSGTNRVVRAYTNGFVNIENGFVKEPSNE